MIVRNHWWLAQEDRCWCRSQQHTLTVETNTDPFRSITWFWSVLQVLLTASLSPMATRGAERGRDREREARGCRARQGLAAEWMFLSILPTYLIRRVVTTTGRSRDRLAHGTPRTTARETSRRINLHCTLASAATVIHPSTFHRQQATARNKAKASERPARRWRRMAKTSAT